MANPEHIALARRGRGAWNAWRRRNAGVAADFSAVDFSVPDLAGISFAGFDFGARADFSHCVFGTADHRAVAARDISPYAAEVAPYIAGGAWFYGARFGPAANFADCRFKGIALFQRAVFGHDADFGRAQFLDEADFVAAAFGHGANFAGAAFAVSLQFDHARFRRGAAFDGRAAAEGRAAVEGRAPLPPADTLPRACFRHARFGGGARFTGRRVLDRLDFAYAAFDGPPDLAGVGGGANIDLHGARFRLREGPIPGWTTQAASLARIRRLRAIAAEGHDDDTARDLFILQRKAERGIAWKNARDAAGADPLRKLGLFGRALGATILLLLYGTFSGCGRSLLRPLAWLAAVNYAAYLAYGEFAKPDTTMVGRAARGTWGWMKSLFVSAPSAPASTSGGSLSGEQVRALFEVWWSSLVPGSVPAAGYEKAVKLLYGEVGLPHALYAVQLAQVALNLLLLFLLGLAIRNHFRPARG